MIAVKWRPPLALLIAGLVSLVFLLPLAGMALVVILSRSPDALLASLIANWGKITVALVAVITLTGFTGYVFWRGLSRPLNQLAEQARAISGGARSFQTSHGYGTQEVAHLANGFDVMVQQLQERSHYLETLSAHLAHELKSPLTSIRGATELLRDSGNDMSEADRLRFLSNIASDTEYLTTLTNRLRDLARADMAHRAGSVTLDTIVDVTCDIFPKLDVRLRGSGETALPMSREDGAIVFHHLAENATRHGATNLTIKLAPNGDRLVIENNGKPISPDLKDQIMDPFFTTARGSGGTGLGLAIVSALITASGGSIELVSCDPVRFEITFPDMRR